MSDDRKLAELVRDALRPRPMGRAEQVAFRVAVEERFERRSAVPWRAGLALAATGVIAAALWLARPAAVALAPEIARVEVPPAAVPPIVAVVAEPIEDEPVLASLADPDEVLDETENSIAYLPDDYFVLASLVEDDAG